jgi:hypothetical protein
MMATAVRLRSGALSAAAAGAPGRAAYLLSGALAAVSATAAAATFWAPGLLRGTAVMNGSARGTALVALLVAVPVLVASMWWAARGSARALAGWLGGCGYLLYNAVLFAFATPFNNAFPGYLAMLGLSAWSIVLVLRGTDLGAFAGRVRAGMPARAIAGYIWLVAGLNTLLWLRAVLPASLSGDPPAFLAGTGLPTNPVYVQDLAFWLPAAAVVAAGLWRRRPAGYLLAGALLSMWVIESVGVAADQWFGHAADPASTVVSAAAVPMFAVLAVAGAVPLTFYHRNLR